MTNYDLLNQDKAENKGVELANKHLNMVKEALKEVNKTAPDRLLDLTISEFKNLMVECFEMLKQREHDTSIKEYERITLNAISTKGGIPISKEW